MNTAMNIKINDRGEAPLLGAFLAVALMAVMVPMLMFWVNYQRQTTLDTNTADEMQQIIPAWLQYVQGNASTLETLASATTPYAINDCPSMLSSTAVNLLPPNFSPVNPYGQTIVCEVLQPTPGYLMGAVITEGGNNIPSGYLARIANLIGPQAGYVPDSTFAGITTVCQSSGCVQGAGNAWTWTTSQYPFSGITPDHLVGFVQYNSANTPQDYLYRSNVPGDPNGTTMATSINMNGNTISNLPNVVPGQACTNPNGIGVNSQGYVVTCVSGTWQNAPTSQWGSISNPTTSTPQYANGSLSLNGSLNTNGNPITAGYYQIGSGYTCGNIGCSLNYARIWAAPCMYQVYGSGTICGPYNWYAQGTLNAEYNNSTYGWSFCANGIECYVSIYSIPVGYSAGWITPYGMERTGTLQ